MREAVGGSLNPPPGRLNIRSSIFNPMTRCPDDQMTKSFYPPLVCISRCGSCLSAFRGTNARRSPSARRVSAPRSSRLRHDRAIRSLHLLVRRPLPERRAQVDSSRRVEAEIPQAVGGQPAAIAAPAERLGRGRDDPERGAVGQAEAIGRGRRRFDDRLDRPVVGGEPLQHLAARDDPCGRPVCRAADVHVLDEPDLGVHHAAVLDQIDQLVVVDAADGHRVDLEARRTRAWQPRCLRARGPARRSGQGPRSDRAAACRGSP